MALYGRRYDSVNRHLGRSSLFCIIQLGSKYNHMYLYKTDTQKRRRQRLERCSHKTRKVGSPQRQRAASSLDPPEGVWSSQCLSLRLWPLELWDSKFLLFKATWFVVICYSGHRKLTQVEKRYLYPWVIMRIKQGNTNKGVISVWCRRRQWHPTPVLLPWKSYGPRSLVGCSPWGR